MIHETTIGVNVEVDYKILPPEPPDLPLQVDIVGIYLVIAGGKAKPRRVNIMGALSESDIIGLEDEILTPEFIERYHLIKRWQEGKL